MGALTDLVFFGGFSVFAWIGAAHQDSRKVVDVPGYAAFKDGPLLCPLPRLWIKAAFECRRARVGVIVLALLVYSTSCARITQLGSAVR